MEQSDKGVIVVDQSLKLTEEGKKALEKAQRRGYVVMQMELPMATLILSERASYWHPDLWKLLDAKLKEMEAICDTGSTEKSATTAKAKGSSGSTTPAARGGPKRAKRVKGGSQ